MKKLPPSLVLLICLLGFPQISETIYTPSLPDLARALSVDMHIAEFTLSVYFIGFAIGVFGLGILADILGRRRSLLIGLLVYILGSLGCQFSSSITALLLFRLIQALGASAGSVITLTMMREVYTGQEKIRAFAIASAALSLSPALGPVIGGFLDQYWGWRSNFSFLVGMGILLTGWCSLRLAETKPAHVQRKKLGPLFQRMMKDPHIWYAAGMIAACNGIIFSYYGEAPYIFIELFHLKPSVYGGLGLLVSSAFILASLFTQKMNKKPEQIIQLGALIALVGSGLLSELLLCHEVGPEMSMTKWGLIFLWIELIFLGIGLVIPNCLAIALKDYQDCLGSAGSILGLTYYILIAGFTALMGMIHTGFASAMPVYFVGLCLFMCIFTLIKKKTTI